MKNKNLKQKNKNLKQKNKIHKQIYLKIFLKLQNKE